MGQHKQTIYIKGMTCGVCVQSVSKLIKNISGVESVVANFVWNKATVISDQVISDVDIEEVLSDSKFSIITREAALLDTFKTWSKKYKPLLIAYTIVLLQTAILPLILWDAYTVHTVMSSFMGAFFIYFGIQKFPSWKSFARSFVEYDHVSQLLPGFVWMVPILEVVIGLLYLLADAPVWLNVFVAVWMSLRTWSVIMKLQSGERPVCACLGAENGVSISSFTIIEDASMAMMAVYMLGVLVGH